MKKCNVDIISSLFFIISLVRWCGNNTACIDILTSVAIIGNKSVSRNQAVNKPARLYSILHVLWIKLLFEYNFIVFLMR